MINFYFKLNIMNSEKLKAIKNHNNDDQIKRSSYQFLFNVGEEIMYMRDTNRPCKIIARKRRKNWLLTEMNAYPIYQEVYITEEIYKASPLDKHDGTKIRFWKDDGHTIRSANFLNSVPLSAVDYESDEYTADYLNSEGQILMSIKSGHPGDAHQQVINSLLLVRKSA